MQQLTPTLDNIECPPGQVEDQRGICVPEAMANICPPGQEQTPCGCLRLSESRCNPDGSVSRGRTCPPGQVEDQRGICVTEAMANICPPGQERTPCGCLRLSESRCNPDGSVSRGRTCPPGRVEDQYGRCVPAARADACPPGLEKTPCGCLQLSVDRCNPDRTVTRVVPCPPGLFANAYGFCIPAMATPPPGACPPGRLFCGFQGRGYCIDPATHTCNTDGSVGLVACAPGQVRNTQGACSPVIAVTPPQFCPPGSQPCLGQGGRVTGCYGPGQVCLAGSICRAGENLCHGLLSNTCFNPATHRCTDGALAGLGGVPPSRTDQGIPPASPQCPPGQIRNALGQCAATGTDPFGHKYFVAAKTIGRPPRCSPQIFTDTGLIAKLPGQRNAIEDGWKVIAGPFPDLSPAQQWLAANPRNDAQCR